MFSPVRVAKIKRSVDAAKEKVCVFIVWRLLPRRLVYWSAIRLGCEATTGKYSDQEVPALFLTEALSRFEKGMR